MNTPHCYTYSTSLQISSEDGKLLYLGYYPSFMSVLLILKLMKKIRRIYIQALQQLELLDDNAVLTKNSDSVRILNFNYIHIAIVIIYIHCKLA